MEFTIVIANKGLVCGSNMKLKNTLFVFEFHQSEPSLYQFNALNNVTSEAEK